MKNSCCVVLSTLGSFVYVTQFAVVAFTTPLIPNRQHKSHLCSSPEEEWSDFEGYNIGDASLESESQGGVLYDDLSPLTFDTSNLLKDNNMLTNDLTACQARLFSLGSDLTVSDYVGNMGFDQVTDWEYYYPSDDEDDDRRQVVQPNPFDSSKPKRTRTSSGSVIRIFRAEFVGMLGGMLQSQGMDRRILIKEFTGKLALKLARAELEAVGKLQSNLIMATSTATDREDFEKGKWIQAASARSVMGRQDNNHVLKLVQGLRSAPFLGILGEVNLAEIEDNVEPNAFYRALGVPPPAPGAVWLVYEYAGLSTVQAYAEPAEARRSKLPPARGFFGNPIPPPKLPSFADRANYVVNGIMKQAIECVGNLHDSGIVHRSIGRTSLILSSKTMDKREASSPYATLTSQLVVKLADFGFSGQYQDATIFDEEFRTRARSFGLSFRQGQVSVTTANFAIAEDMHALGFVFLGLLLTSLAEVPGPDFRMPATDEDSLQRLLVEIFDKDFEQFREYVEAEEVWSDLVSLLDKNNGAGWTVLETLMLAREKVAQTKDSKQLLNIKGLLSSPFFS